MQLGRQEEVSEDAYEHGTLGVWKTRYKVQCSSCSRCALCAVHCALRSMLTVSVTDGDVDVDAASSTTSSAPQSNVALPKLCSDGGQGDAASSPILGDCSHERYRVERCTKCFRGKETGLAFLWKKQCSCRVVAQRSAHSETLCGDTLPVLRAFCNVRLRQKLCCARLRWFYSNSFAPFEQTSQGA